MSIYYMTKAFQEAQDISPTQKLILLSLCDNADDNGVCYPSFPIIMQKSNVSEKTIQRTIKLLKKKGYIDYERRFNNSYLYTLFPKIDTSVKLTERTNQDFTKSPKIDTSVKLTERTNHTVRIGHGCPLNHQESSEEEEEERLSFFKNKIDDYINWLKQTQNLQIKNLSNYKIKLIINFKNKDEKTLLLFEEYLKQTQSQSKKADLSKLIGKNIIIPDDTKVTIVSINEVKEGYSVGVEDDSKETFELIFETKDTNSINNELRGMM